MRMNSALWTTTKTLVYDHWCKPIWLTWYLISFEDNQYPARAPTQETFLISLLRYNHTRPSFALSWRLERINYKHALMPECLMPWWLICTTALYAPRSGSNSVTEIGTGDDVTWSNVSRAKVLKRQWATRASPRHCVRFKARAACPRTIWLIFQFSGLVLDCVAPSLGFLSLLLS